MVENKKVEVATGGWLFWSFIWGCVGYLVYGTIEGAIGLALYSAIAGVTMIFGLVPVLGVMITHSINNYVMYWVLQYIPHAWPLSVIFWMSIAGSIFLTTIIPLIVLLRD